MNGFAKYLLIILLASAGQLSAQNDEIEKLKQEMERLEQEINFTRQKMTEVKSKKENTLHSLVTLKKQITSRQQLVTNIEQQIGAIEREMDEKRRVIRSLNNDLDRLKEEYAEMIYRTYVNNNSYNNLLFVFSSSSFNDAYNRLMYLKTYADYREKQAELIRRTKRNIQEEIDKQQALKNEKEELLTKERRQQSTLQSERQQVNQKLKTFEKQEDRYKQEIASKEKAVSELNNKIEQLIAEAMKKKETKSEGTRSGYEVTPEAQALGENFEANKGKLPWPVEHGTIIREFGDRPHPVLKNVTESNPGIGISTNDEETVRAVFEGTVAEVFYTPSHHRLVMIDHGTYFSVYGNLKQVAVSKGQTVATKQSLGTVYTDPDSGASELEFMIWKSTSGGTALKLNPALWLYR